MSHTRTVILFGIFVALVSLNALVLKAMGKLDTIQAMATMQQAHSVIQQQNVAWIRTLLDPSIPSQFPALATPMVQS